MIPQFPTGELNPNHLMLKAQISDLTTNLTREKETKHNIEARCKEYTNQIEDLNTKFEEYKQKNYNRSYDHENEITTYEE